ncbi:DUF423 domain-containing protein [Pigmentibacter sp. JX0631]|uniref:DUF423 domain-containing protein n=1 Tax=Pigmentibacter sp. JX0631 TaxID=2976982 RepID=UPI002469508F|nr:DUF423 domain-containing protein [Pigmentibacter sp. JX0631]WGL58604.1 DUF423 domain-containing protein [Pigmentibacter sp. JX0631]
MFYQKLFSFFGFLGVSLGAFGAHGLKNKVSLESLEIWKTATLYLLVHVIIGLLSLFFAKSKKSAFCFALGSFLFAGSLYLLVILNMPILGIVTPFGGTALLIGWIFLFFDFKKEIFQK